MAASKTDFSGSILVVDDEPDLRTLYELTLRKQGYAVQTAADLFEARHWLQDKQFDVVITDMCLPDGQGLDLLREMAVQQRTERCVVITAHGCAENAVDSLKAGAFDYLTKPVDLKQFRRVVDSAVHSLDEDWRDAAKLNRQPSIATKPTPAAALDGLVAQSASMQAIKATVAKVAGSMAPVLIEGEGGTGKEFLARVLHRSSHRASGPFVVVSCVGLASQSLEALFFGVRKDAYGNWTQDKPGYFQQAQGGTLFLEDVDQLPLAMQAKLLHAIEERAVRPLGSVQEDAVDVRVVSSTTQDLIEQIKLGHFRQDLYYRLNVVRILLPALRERRQDLPGLCHALLTQMVQADSAGASLIPPVSESMLAQLHVHPLPGNVRELQNLLHRALALNDGGPLELGGAPAGQAQNLPDLLEAQERAILIKTLEETRYNRTAAASKLGMSLRQIRYRIARLNIPIPNQDHDD